ncbi:helix-turn-helix domain-containing protein [Spirosoma daeguense]
MSKPIRTFDYLFDRLEEISSRLDYLITLTHIQPSPALDSPLLTTRKAAEFLGVSPKTIYNNPERYPHVKLKGGGLRFRKADLEEFVTASTRHA